jgi:hypothetical protein
LSGSSPLTCLAWKTLPVAYATTSIALEIIWPHKPRHYAKVGIPSGSVTTIYTCYQIQLRIVYVSASYLLSQFCIWAEIDNICLTKIDDNIKWMSEYLSGLDWVLSASPDKWPGNTNRQLNSWRCGLVLEVDDSRQWLLINSIKFCYMTQWTNLIPTNIQKLAAWRLFWLSLDYLQRESEACCD